MRKEYEKENFIWKFISLTLLLLAFFLAARDGLCIGWWSSKDLFFTCLLVSAFVTVSGYHRWTRIAGGLLGVLVEGSMLWFHRAEIWKELQYCYHHVIPLVNDYYDTFYQYDIRQRHGDIQTLIFVIAIPVGVLLGLGIRRGKNKNGKTGRLRVLFFLPLVAAFSCGLMLGYGPRFGAVLCLLLGFAFRLLLSYGQEPAWKQKEDCLMFLCIFGAIGLSALCYLPLSQNALHYHRQLKEFQTSLEDSMKDIGNGSFFSGLWWKLGWYDDTAKLTNREPRLTKDRIFTVTVDQKPDSPLYFKTFVGGDYDNGVWYSAGENGFEEYCQSKGLDSQALGAAILTQNGSIGMSYRPKPWNMIVQLLKRNGELSPYPYYPWGVSLPEEAQVVGDRGIRYNKGNSYQLKMGRERGDQFSSLSSSVILDEGSAGEEYRIPLEIVDIPLEIVETPTPLGDYQDYVEDVYTRLPEGQLSRLREAYDTGSLFDRTILEAMMKENYYVSDISVKWILGDYLDENFQYSLDLSPVPEGEDIVEYFLLDQKKGYCMHFASAATLLYRMEGIPARYVSGYIVTPGDFVENEDGTYTATVTGMRAHAWVETYNPSDGWSNDEVTPPDFQEGLWNAGAGDSPRDIIAALEREDRPEDTPSNPYPQPDNPPEDIPDNPLSNTPQTTPKQPNQPTQNHGQSEEEQRPGGIFGLGIGFGTGNGTVDMVLTVVCYFLFVVLLLGLVILLFFLRYRLIWDRRKRSFQDTDVKKAATAIVRETFRLLRISGIVYTGWEDEAAFAAETERKLPCMKAGEFTAFIEIACAARYGGRTLTEQQRKYLLMIYKRLRSYEKDQLNVWRRFWYRNVLVRI